MIHLQIIQKSNHQMCHTVIPKPLEEPPSQSTINTIPTHKKHPTVDPTGASLYNRISAIIYYRCSGTQLNVHRINRFQIISRNAPLCTADMSSFRPGKGAIRTMQNHLKYISIVVHHRSTIGCTCSPYSAGESYISSPLPFYVTIEHSRETDTKLKHNKCKKNTIINITKSSQGIFVGTTLTLKLCTDTQSRRGSIFFAVVENRT